MPTTDLTAYQRKLTEIYAGLLWSAALTAKRKPGVLVGSGGAGYVAYKQGRLILAYKIAGGWSVCFEVGTLTAARLIQRDVLDLKAAQKLIDSIEDFNNGQIDFSKLPSRKSPRR